MGQLEPISELANYAINGVINLWGVLPHSSAVSHMLSISSHGIRGTLIQQTISHTLGLPMNGG